MNNFIKKALYFVRLTDDEGLLSITHIACMVVLYKVAMASEPSVTDMGALLITLALYYGKRHVQSKRTKLTDDSKVTLTEMQTKVQNIQDKLAGIAASIGFRNVQK